MIFAYSLVIGCSLMHIMCCVVPITLAILGLGATLGLAQSTVLEGGLFQRFEQFELEFLLMSGIILLSLFIMKNKAQKVKCCPKTQKSVCHKSEKLNGVFFRVSALLYVFSLMNYTISNFI